MAGVTGVEQSIRRWWESSLFNKTDQEERVVSRLHCLEVVGEWWVAEVATHLGLVQQVANSNSADDPEHYFLN